MKRLLGGIASLLLLAGCGTGIDAGGETLGENGGVAWILMATMLVVIGVVMWWIMGRED